MSSDANSVSLDVTMGALYIGVVLSMALWGAGSVQVYYYYNEYHKDRYTLKLLVFVVWLLDTVHQGLITQSCYAYLISNWGSPVHLATLEQTLIIMVLFTAMICLLVQSFFTLRIWRLSDRNILLTGFVYIWVVAQFISTMYYFSKAIHFNLFEQLLSIKSITRSINVINAVADAAIASALVFLLRRSRTGFRRSERIIVRLIHYSVGTGTITGIIAIVCLIMNLVLPLTFYYILFYLMTSRLYMNSLLATLNARKHVLSNFGDTFQSFLTTSVSMDHFRTPSSLQDPADPRNHTIKIDPETATENSYKNTESDTYQKELSYSGKAA